MPADRKAHGSASGAACLLALAAAWLAPGAELRAQAAPLFPGPRPFTDCGGTWRVAAADLDLDGHLDLVADREAGGPLGGNPGLVRLLGRGDGTFGPPLAVPGSEEDDFVVGDVNGDRYPDLVTFEHGVSGSQWPEISLLARLGDGHGAFGPPIATLVITQKSFAHALAGGDFDNDGLTDILARVEVPAPRTVLLRSNGDGTFTSLGYAAFTSGAMLPADVNRDGKLDLVLGEHLQVALGDGHGHFADPIENDPLFTAYDQLQAGDLDNDGAPDLLTKYVSGITFVWRGAGDGHFTQVSSFTDPGGTHGPRIADLDGDGLPDVVAAQSQWIIPFYPKIAGGLTVHRNLGGLQFDAGTLCRTGGSPYTLALLDANEDGRIDVASGQLIFSEGVAQAADLGLSLGTGDGAFFSRPLVTPLPGKPLRLALVALDGDAFPDLVVLREAGPTAASVALGVGAGAFGPAVDVDLGEARDRLLVADLNGDGHPDLAATAATSGGPLLVAFGAGLTAFGEPQVIGAGGVAALRAADLDGDGDLDLVVARTAQQAVGVLLNLGAGAFAPEVAWPASVPITDVCVADVTGDGIRDLLAAGSKVIVLQTFGRLVLFPGLGDGTFAPPVVTSHPSVPRVLLAADVDGDGSPEVVTSDLDESLRVRHGAADGTLSAPLALPIGTVAFTLLAADVNRDGRTDLLAGATTPPLPTGDPDDEGVPGEIVLLPGAAGGGFQPALHSFTGGSPQDLAVADLDADGFPDLLAPSRSGDELWVLLNPSPTWASLGLALPGAFGTPLLTGSGTPAPDQQVSLLATGVPAPSFGLAFLGLQASLTPFLGGVLVPAPTAVLPIRPNVALSARWPHGLAPGTPLYAQAWFATPPTVPVTAGQISATNALVTIAQ